MGDERKGTGPVRSGVIPRTLHPSSLIPQSMIPAASSWIRFKTRDLAT